MLQDLWDDFETLEDAHKVRYFSILVVFFSRSAGKTLNITGSVALQVVKLKAFSKFDCTVDALTSTAALVDSKLPKGDSILSSECGEKGQCYRACPCSHALSGTEGAINYS